MKQSSLIDSSKLQNIHNERAPLLWFLIPFIGGIANAEKFFFAIELQLLIASLLTIGCLFALRKESRQTSWKLLYLLSAFLIGINYATLKIPKTTPLTKDIPHYIEVSAKIDQLFGARRSGKFIQGLATVQSVQKENLKVLEKQKIYFTAWIKTETPLKGSIVALKGKLKVIDKPKTSFEKFLKKNKCTAIIQSKSLKTLTPSSKAKRVFHNIKKRFIKQLKVGVDDEEAYYLSNITNAMILGAKDQLNPKQKSNYGKKGTMHLFAVSGLHVGWVAFFLGMSLMPLKFSYKIRIISLIALLLLYVQITGANPSAVRAWLMISCFLLAGILKRRPYLLSSLVSSACIVLLINPSELFSLGFQLSYMVVFGLVLYGLSLKEYFERKLELFKWIPETSLKNWQKGVKASMESLLVLFSISFTASLFSSVLIIGNFGIFTPISIFINILLVPISGLIIFSGLLALIFGNIGLESVNIFFNKSAWVWVDIIEHIIEWSLKIPKGYFEITWSYPSFNWIAPITLLVSTAFFVPQQKATLRQLLIPPTIFLVFLIL